MMIRITTGITLLLCFIFSGGLAQSVAGFWLGVTYPSNPNQKVFNYTTTLTQTGTTLGGTAQTANPNVPFGGTAYLTGRVTGTAVTFSEADQTGSTSTVQDLCYWKVNLVYNPTDESLIGTYENIVNTTTCTEAGNGKVELYRIVLKSGAKFCKGSPMDLRVTGKDIRWYSSAAKTNLLATGNTFSPSLNQTTTFYITQTLYRNESPAVPITIEVIDPAFRATATNADCGQSNATIAVAIPNPANWQYSLNSGAFQASPSFANLGPGTYTVAVRDEAGCRAEQSVAVVASAAPTISELKMVSPRCGLATGEVSLTATGGTGALTYSINGTAFQPQPLFRNLAGGDYTARVRDTKGCEATRPVSLPTSFSVGIASVSTTSATCGQTNGSLTVTTTGGSGAMQYSLDGQTYQPGSTLANLKGGAYTLLVRDGAGCTATQSVSVAGSSLTIDDLKATPPRCGTANGALSVSATGGIGTLTYTLDGTRYQSSAVFSNLPGGSYTVRVRDASGCEVSKTSSLPLSNPLLVVGINAVPTTCGLSNGRASMTVSGGAGPIRFSTDGRRAQAGNTFDSLSAGTYTLFAQDSAGCAAGRSVTIAASALPVITELATTPEACGQKNASIIITTAGPTSQYTYSIDGQTFQSGNAFTALSGGNYAVVVRDQNACVTTRPLSLAVDCANAIHLPTAFSPNNDNLNDALTTHFSFPSLTVARFVVYDRWGSVVFSRVNFALTNGEPIWNGQVGNGDPAPAGIYPYMLHCQFPDGTPMTYRHSVAVVK
ncbi:T9SS type B sorting domain-containing protein [Spirosoma arcticum]